MNCLPVIAMEFRSATRRRGTAWLRLFFALAGMTACLVVLILPRLAPARKGLIMLIVLTGMSLCLVVLSGILLTRVFRALGTERGTASAPARGARLALAPALRRNPYEWLVLRGSDEWRLLGVVNTTLLILYGTMLVVSVTTPYWQLGFSTAFFTALGIHVITKLRFAVEATRQIHSDRQGGLELLLVTPLSEREIIDGYHWALRALAGKPLALMIGLNFAPDAWVVLFPGRLHMGHGPGRAFTMIFLGGAALAAADLVAIRWLALRHGLRASSHVKAVLGTFGWLMVVPWIGFGLVVAAVSILQPRGDAAVGSFFAAWAVGVLVYDALLVMRCRDQVRGTPLTSGVFRS
jgi:hypothetical protein